MTAKSKQGRTLGLEAFAAITAVEGLGLSTEGRRRLAELNAKKLNPEQKRAEILKAYQARKCR